MPRVIVPPAQPSADQERAQMMHHHVLDAVEEEHVLRPVLEPRLQHGVDRDEAE